MPGAAVSNPTKVARPGCSEQGELWLGVAPFLRQLHGRRAAAGGSDAVDGALARVVAASAEGYAFPVNLDRAPPVGGLAPPSQADLVLDALRGARSPDELERALEQHADDRLTDEV